MNIIWALVAFSFTIVDSFADFGTFNHTFFAATPADQYRRRAHVSKYVRHFVLRLPFLDWPDSDIAIAIACFRLFTFFPDPLRNSPRFFSCMTFLTFLF